MLTAALSSLPPMLINYELQSDNHTECII